MLLINRISFIFCIFILILYVILSLFSNSYAGIKGTKHDLSFYGPGSIKSTNPEEDRVCVFCHTPHNAYPAYPLWGHELTIVEYYTKYTSDTLVSYSSEAEAPPIDGVSRLCLSCHDGTVALGAIISGEPIQMSYKVMPKSASGYLGTNLSGGHPISILFDESLAIRRSFSNPNLMQLNWPIQDPDVKLYPTQGGYGVQCSCCHDPHGGKTDDPPFWRKYDYDDVCLVCHNVAPVIGH